MEPSTQYDWQPTLRCVEIWKIDWSAWQGYRSDANWKPTPARIGEEAYIIDIVSLRKLSQSLQH